MTARADAARVAHGSSPAREFVSAETGDDRATRGDTRERVGTRHEGVAPLFGRLADLHAEVSAVYRELAKESEVQLASTADRALMETMATAPGIAPPAPGTRLLTARDVGDLVGVGARTIRRWRDEGRLPPAIVVAGVVRWKREVVERWLDENTEASR